MYKRFTTIHFVGIGGVGMSGIAEVLKNLGYGVSGSDIKETETTRRLRSLGIDIKIGHAPENVKGAQVVVVSSAIPPDNPEVITARRLSIPVIPRAEMLAEIGNLLKYRILIAGSHGKTTTTSIIASILSSCGLDPTVLIGGKLKGMGSNARLGRGDFLVAEADESDGSFLKLSPTIAVVTNIDREHMDFFKDVDALKRAFIEFINKVPFYGISVLCLDDSRIREILPHIRRRHVTYGFDPGADLTVRDVTMGGLRSGFEAVLRGSSLGRFEVPLPGWHNVSNCLASIAVAHELELDMEGVRDSLRGFSGVHRRFEFKGRASGISVFDDYGHHPTEIMATLRAAKEAKQSGSDRIPAEGRLVVLFQPHRYTRTRALLREFCTAFKDADKVILMDIYPAGERQIEGVHSGVLFEGIKASGKDVEYIKDRAEIVPYLAEQLREGDTLLTLGAGDVWRLGEEFLRLMGDRRSTRR